MSNSVGPCRPENRHHRPSAGTPLPGQKTVRLDLVQQLAGQGGRSAHARMSAGPAGPSGRGHQRLAFLGSKLAGLHRELAADALDFDSVASCGNRIPGFREQARWQALAEIQRLYLQTLDRLDLWDLQTARLFAIRHGECHTDARIVLVGLADLNRSQRLMLDQVSDQVTALVLRRLNWPVL